MVPYHRCPFLFAGQEKMADQIGIRINQGVPSNGLVRVVSPDELTRQETETQRIEQQQRAEPVANLASIIEDAYRNNREYREQNDIDEAMLEDLRQRDGEYDPDKQAAIEAMGGSDVFPCLTQVKCNAAEAWISDVFTVNQERAWRLEPTPKAELQSSITQSVVERTMSEWLQQVAQTGQFPPISEVAAISGQIRDEVEMELQEEARTRADRMANKIRDQLTESKFDDIFESFITDIITLGIGILKGPVIRKKKQLQWKKVGQQTRPDIKQRVRHDFERVSPFDLYPSPGCTDINEGTLIERIKFSRRSLRAMKGLPGWDSDAIDAVLVRHGNGDYRNWTSTDQTRSELERKGSDLSKQKDWIEGLEFWGSVQGKYLFEHNITEDLNGKKLDVDEEYEINSVKIGTFIVFCDFNRDPLEKRPYKKTVYRPIPGSFYGKGAPRLMRDLQAICGASVRALCNNLGIASGPQVVINDINALAPGEDVTSLYAWKIWQFIKKGVTTEKQIDFFQPKSNAAELVSVYNTFAKLADDYTGIPAYSYGNDDVAGAGRTYSGLSVLMNSAARGIKKVILRIGQYVIGPIVEDLFIWNMLYDPDESIKGDVQVVPSGVISMIMKEQTAAQRERFLQTTNNSTDLQLMGLDGRAVVLREQAKELDIPVEKVVKTPEEVQAIENQLKQMAEAVQAQAAGGNMGSRSVRVA
jgi:hypothetical protein